MKVLFIAAPLVTKGGVFRSTCELVEAGRSRGLDWSALIVTRGELGVSSLPNGIDMCTNNDVGIRGLRKLRTKIRRHPEFRLADVVISLIPQTDVILASLRKPRNQLHVAFVRGAAWPRKGETAAIKRYIWRLVERKALKRKNAVWATTPILRSEIEWPRARIVPAGIALKDIRIRDHQARLELVWAARMSSDKNPELFLEVARDVKMKATMYGEGEMREQLQNQAPQNALLPGWTDPDSLWKDGHVYLGTSFREAFGRSAVEAAAVGLPVILSRAFGAAPLLVTDPDLRRRFVLDPHDKQAWVEAAKALMWDTDLRGQLGRHVQTNAMNLTIEMSTEAVHAELQRLMQELVSKS